MIVVRKIIPISVAILYIFVELFGEPLFFCYPARTDYRNVALINILQSIGIFVVVVMLCSRSGWLILFTFPVQSVSVPGGQQQQHYFVELIYRRQLQKRRHTRVT